MSAAKAAAILALVLASSGASAQTRARRPEKERPIEQGSEEARRRALALSKDAYRQNQDADDDSYLVLAAQLALSLQKFKDFRDAVDHNAAPASATAAPGHYFPAWMSSTHCSSSRCNDAASVFSECEARV